MKLIGKETAGAVKRTHLAGGRVIAVGTTVVRALESAWTPDGVVPLRHALRAAGVRAIPLPWTVQRACRAVTVSSGTAAVTMYDCLGRADAIAPATGR